MKFMLFYANSVVLSVADLRWKDTSEFNTNIKRRWPR